MTMKSLLPAGCVDDAGAFELRQIGSPASFGRSAGYGPEGAFAQGIG
jgi:hypothetical protein